MSLRVLRVLCALRDKPRRNAGSLSQAEEFQHLAIQLMAMEWLVPHVGAAAVEDAEGAAEVPEGPAPAGFSPEGEIILHPGEDHVVRGELVGAPFADVHADALLLQRLPRLD